MACDTKTQRPRNSFRLRRHKFFALADLKGCRLVPCALTVAMEHKTITPAAATLIICITSRPSRSVLKTRGVNAQEPGFPRFAGAWRGNDLAIANLTPRTSPIFQNKKPALGGRMASCVLRAVSHRMSGMVARWTEAASRSEDFHRACNLFTVT
jgi:hypothetical protein